jgi:hypothetical protein
MPEKTLFETVIEKPGHGFRELTSQNFLNILQRILQNVNNTAIKAYTKEAYTEAITNPLSWLGQVFLLWLDDKEEELEEIVPGFSFILPMLPDLGENPFEYLASSLINSALIATIATFVVIAFPFAMMVGILLVVFQNLLDVLANWISNGEYTNQIDKIKIDPNPIQNFKFILRSLYRAIHPLANVPDPAGFGKKVLAIITWPLRLIFAVALLVASAAVAITGFAIGNLYLGVAVLYLTVKVASLFVLKLPRYLFNALDNLIKGLVFAWRSRGKIAPNLPNDAGSSHIQQEISSTTQGRLLGGVFSEQLDQTTANNNNPPPLPTNVVPFPSPIGGQPQTVAEQQAKGEEKIETDSVEARC